LADRELEGNLAGLAVWWELHASRYALPLLLVEGELTSDQVLILLGCCFQVHR
jgi:hypothetical protein